MRPLIILNDPPYGAERNYSGTCMDARGLAEAEIAPGTRRSTTDGLTAAAIATDKVLVF